MAAVTDLPPTCARALPPTTTPAPTDNPPPPDLPGPATTLPLPPDLPGSPDLTGPPDLPGTATLLSPADATRYDLRLWTATTLGLIGIPAAVVPLLGLPVAILGVLTARSAIKTTADLPVTMAGVDRRIWAWVAVGLTALTLALAIVVFGLEIHNLTKGNPPRLRPWDYGKPVHMP
jgi:hypothetical protein